MSEPVAGELTSSLEIEGESIDARLNRYRLFDEVNAPYMRWQLEQFEPHLGNRLLEVGCGVGSILAQLRPREFVMGVDVEDELVTFARHRLAARGDEFARLDISALSPAERSMLKERRFDTVVCINVLEHVVDDTAAVAAMADLVEPGGKVAILVPAHPALYGAYDRMEGHLRRYSRSGLSDLLSRSGLEVIRLHRFNLVGAAGWWVQYRLLRQRIHSQGHFKILQTLLPVMRSVEAHLKPPVGLSLVAVAIKPRGPQP